MDYKKFFEKRAACMLPRWDDLPDIEIYMDQVITLMTKYFADFFPSGEQILTSSMINNYVKNEIIPAPVKKKYSRTHLFRLVIICMMKSVMPIPDIGRLIDTMLKTNTEEDVLDIFAKQYESEYYNTMSLLKDTIEKNYDRRASDDEVLCFSIMHAAAISGSSKLYAENMLAEMHLEKDAPEEKPKKKKKTAVPEK